MTHEYVIAELCYEGRFYLLSNQHKLYISKHIKHYMNPYQVKIEELSIVNIEDSKLEKILNNSTIEYKNDRSNKKK